MTEQIEHIAPKTLRQKIIGSTWNVMLIGFAWVGVVGDFGHIPIVLWWILAVVLSLTFLFGVIADERLRYYCLRLELAEARGVVVAGRIFAENHGQFHPDFWAAGRRGTGLEWCAGCDFGKAFTTAYPQEPK